MTALPPISRIAKALVAASAIAAWPTWIAIPMALSAGPAALVIVALGLGVALGHALLLGLPLYLLLARRGAPRTGTTMLAGGLIGALPITILIAVSEGQGAFGLALPPAILFGFCGWLGSSAFDFVVSRAKDVA